MKLILFLVGTLLWSPLVVLSQTDKMYAELNKALDKSSEYDAHKLRRIEHIKKALSKNRANSNLTNKYFTYLQLFNEYESFNYDSAYVYSHKLQNIGQLLKDDAKLSYGKVKLGFILLTSGRYKESFDCLNSVNVKVLNKSAKAEYYYTKARAYYDLGEYNDDKEFTPQYNKLAGLLIDSGSVYSDPNSFSYIFFKGDKANRSGNKTKALYLFNELLTNHKLTEHEIARTAAATSRIYYDDKLYQKAKTYMIKASIADIRSSTKETTAIYLLSQCLHNNKDFSKAYLYINKAMDDANTYGAKQRKITVSKALSEIANENVNNIEAQKRGLYIYAFIITFLSVLVVISLVVIFKQLSKITLADVQIRIANQHLKEANNKLVESTRIKEEFIGYYFNLISEHIDKIEKLKRSIDAKLTTRKFDDIKIIINNINLKKEREALFETFDKVFLKIYPDFVSNFNSLFKETDQIKICGNKLLNTDMRIFALIKMGIVECEQIARILQYSVNTIYSYKTRIKAKSIVSTQEFEERILC
ncbi:MAG: hypothetical protein JWN56_548 [Sphingobacteriales bacterium]|nr:hypothetical protein [Sphingobacteriales bacterium]